MCRAYPCGMSTAPAEVTRVCTFCMSRRPLAELGQVAYTLQCLDTTACLERARASGIYPQPADEQQIAAREARQGALR